LLNNKSFVNYEAWFKYPVGDILKMVAIANEVNQEESEQIKNSKG
jgi:hypothetical protein